MHISALADHAGFSPKQPVIEIVEKLGHDVVELGKFSEEAVDFPDVVLPVCESVIEGRANRGFLVCATGIGACMAANKVPGIRAAVCHDVNSAHQSVEHDDACVMCLGAKIVGEWLAADLIAAFLNAGFGGEEHYVRRIAKMSEIEKQGLLPD